jgi:hypothetical protein
MKSPFPGMDPFIEGHGRLWEDFHQHLIEDVYRTIAAALPPNYVVQSQPRVYLLLTEAEGKTQRPFIPDVGAFSTERRQAAGQQAAVAVAEPATATDDPQTLLAFVTEQYREQFLEVYEVEPEWRLVTCIEVLSPSNKRPNTAGWDQYLRKRQALLLGEANLVEIDLLRGGTRMPMYNKWPDSPFVLTVCRREQAPLCKVWRGYFDRPLPAIPVPLSAPHADVTLELQPLVEATYARSRYHLRIDYTKPLTPPLSEEQTAWLAQRLRERAE